MNLFLLAIYLISLSLYFPLNHRPSKYYFPSVIDKYFPLLPQTVWFYISYYLLQPITLLVLWSKPIFTTTLIVLIISTLISSLIWWLFPNGVKRPNNITQKTISKKILLHIYSRDGDSNGFPSGHISHTLICSYFLIQSFPHLFLAIYLWCIAICISTITTKQHYLFDYIFTTPFTFLIIHFFTFVY